MAGTHAASGPSGLRPHVFFAVKSRTFAPRSHRVAEKIHLFFALLRNSVTSWLRGAKVLSLPAATANQVQFLHLCAALKVSLSGKFSLLRFRWKKKTSAFTPILPRA